MTGKDMRTKEGLITLLVFAFIAAFCLATYEDTLASDRCEAFHHSQYSAC